MKMIVCLSTLAMAATVTPAYAQPTEQPDTFVRLGIARIDLADKGAVFVNGTRDPGADYKTDKDWIGSIEIGHYVHRNVAVRVMGTTPVRSTFCPNVSPLRASTPTTW